MVLNVRRRQTDALIKLLHFNDAFKEAAGSELFKVLVIDAFTLKVVATLLHTEALRQHGVTLVLHIERDREAIADAPVVYFVQATPANASAMVRDLESGLYKEAHINFASWAPRALLETLATGAVKSATSMSVAKVFDQYLSFIALEGSLFTLALGDSYVHLNDNAASEAQLQAAVTAVVEGLFSACVTLAVIPVIRCAPGGLAEHIANALCGRIAEHLRGRGASLFSEGNVIAASAARPLLCLFDRNFDLIPMVEQPFTYKALVHDCLGMQLNKVDIKAGPAGTAAGKDLSIEISEDDAFWEQNGHQEFGAVAAEVETQLKNYQGVMNSLVKSGGAASGSDHPDADEASAIQEATKALMTTVRSLPELRAQKKKLDGHMNLLYTLLSEIKGRTLDRFHEVGQSLLSGDAELAEVTELLQGTAGTAEDKLRLAVLFLLVSDNLPKDADLEAMQAALQAASADVEAFHYVKRMRQMNLTGRASKGGPGASLGAAAGSQNSLLGLVDNSLMSGLAGQVRKHVAKFVGGLRQALVVSTVAQLMEGQPSKGSQSPSPVDTFLTLDPKAQAGKGGTAGQALKGPFKEAIVFMIGGGNYLERERLSQWAQTCTPRRHIVYGATEMLTGAQFCGQLALLGQKSGAS